MNVDRRVVAFLRSNIGRNYCRQCIALAVPRPEGGHINIHQAGNAIRSLEDIDEFVVETSECSSCGEFRKVAGAR